jgi:uncharacterized damage-inducible protein DinB
MNPLPVELVPDAVTGCVEACRRCDAVVDAVVAQDLAAFPFVGPHLRHCVDHFRLLLDGWRSGVVDYDARARDVRLERDPQAVRDALASISGSLAGLRSQDLPHELTVVQSAAPGRPPVSSPSRLERELVFVSGHTIHHIAIMLLAARAAGVEIPPQLAVAYSTEAQREPLAMSR